MKKEDKEIKVYVVNADNDFDFREEEQKGNFKAIINEAKRQGSVYSLKNFQDAINDEVLFLDNAFILIQ